MAPKRPKGNKSDAALTPNPKRTKKEPPSSGKPPSAQALPSPPKLNVEGYVSHLLQKVDEIHDGGKNVYEWLENEIRGWPEGAAGWAASLDEAFPAEKDINYVTEKQLMEDPDGPSAVVHARLSQLALHPQAGASGMIEAPVARTLIGSILCEGFCTDASSVQGTEMMAGMPPNPKLTEAWSWQCPHVVNGKLAAPLFSIFHVKGWKRAVAAATVATLAMKLEAELPSHVAASFATVHVLLKRPKSIRESIEAGRQITMISAATRMRPNCFNYVHQLMLLRSEGSADWQAEVAAWNKKKVMEAPAGMTNEFGCRPSFGICFPFVWALLGLGRNFTPRRRRRRKRIPYSPPCLQVLHISPAEAEAAKNLVVNVPDGVRSILQRLAENFGFSGKYAPLTHAALASDMLCLSQGPKAKNQTWTNALKNDEETLKLLAERIDGDWRKAPKVIRKTLTPELLARKQRVTATFRHACGVLQSRVPQETFQAEFPALREKFMEGLLDDELHDASMNEEEPWTLKDIPDFRHILSREDAKTAHQTRQVAVERAQRAAQATLEMLLHDLEADGAVLDKWLEEKRQATQERDRAICKYRSDRYKRGTERAEEFLNKRLRFVDVPSPKFIPREISAARRHIEQSHRVVGGGAPPVQPELGGGAPAEHLLFFLDLNVDYSSETCGALAEASKFLHTMPNAAIILRLLTRHSNLTPERALTIHRKIEDQLLKEDVCLQHEGSIHLTIPAEHGRDRRSLEMRYRILVANQFAKDSPWLLTDAARGNGGNAPLIRPRDMMAATTRRGPAADQARLNPAERVLQLGMDVYDRLISGLCAGLGLASARAPGAPEPRQTVLVVHLQPGAVAELGQCLQRHIISTPNAMDLPNTAFYYVGIYIREGACLEPGDPTVASYDADGSQVCNPKALPAHALALKKMMEEWWGAQPDAGPAEMPTVTESPAPTLTLCVWENQTLKIPDAAGAKFPEGTDAHEVWIKQSRDFLEKYNSQQGSEINSAEVNAPPNPAGPDFGDAPPMQGLPVWEPDGRPDRPVFIAAAKIDREPQVEVGIEKETGAIFLSLGKEVDGSRTVAARELFGFGRGEYIQDALQAVKTKLLPCVIQTDTSWVVLASKDPPSKQLVPLATAIFKCERDCGIPDVGVSGHTLARRADANGNAMFHRYDVVANAGDQHFYFSPAEVEITEEMRFTELGAAWVHSIQVPEGPQTFNVSSNVGVLWELSLNSVPPASLDFVKPKVWLTRSVFMKPGLYYKL